MKLWMFFAWAYLILAFGGLVWMLYEIRKFREYRGAVGRSRVHRRTRRNPGMGDYDGSSFSVPSSDGPLTMGKPQAVADRELLELRRMAGL